MRLVPDQLRGRVGTTDRAAELLIWSFSTAVAGWSLKFISARTLTVIAGLLSATSGVLWLGLFALRLVRLPRGMSLAGTEPDRAASEVGAGMNEPANPIGK